MFYKLMSKIIPNRCREIPHVSGGILLQQIRVFKNCYLQHFVQPEVIDIFHLHRWSKMRSFILCGHYVEERIYSDRTTNKIEHSFLESFSMDRSVNHRIDYWSPRCWTLFIYSDDDLGWGYIDKDFNYTPWDKYIPDDKIVESI